MMITTATGLGTRVRKTNPIRHTELITVTKRFTAMNRVILILNVGGFIIGICGWMTGLFQDHSTVRRNGVSARCQSSG